MSSAPLALLHQCAHCQARSFIHACAGEIGETGQLQQPVVSGWMDEKLPASSSVRQHPNQTQKRAPKPKQGSVWCPPGFPRPPLLMMEVRKCGKLNEDLPPAGQSPSGALARNTHQILVHTLWTILHRCMRRGVVTKKVCPGLRVW